MSLLTKVKMLLASKTQDDEGWIRKGKVSVGKNLRDMASDSQGWFQQGKFTPGKQIQKVGSDIGYQARDKYFQTLQNAWSPGGTNYNTTKTIQRGINKVANLNRISLPKPQVKNKLGQTAMNLAYGIPESIVNTPRNYVTGIARTGLEFGNAKKEGRKVNLQNLVGGLAPLAESIYDVGTFGGAKVVKNIAKEGLEQVAKGGMKAAIKQGAIKGAAIGGFGGLTYGVDTQYGKKFNTKEVALSALGGAILGGAIGGITGATSGTYKKLENVVTGKVKELNPKLSDKQAKSLATRYIQDESGLMMGSRPKDYPKKLQFYGDLRESLGVGRYGENVPQLGNSIRSLTKEEHLDKLSRSQPSIPEVKPTIKIKAEPGVKITSSTPTSLDSTLQNTTLSTPPIKPKTIKVSATPQVEGANGSTIQENQKIRLTNQPSTDIIPEIDTDSYIKEQVLKQENARSSVGTNKIKTFISDLKEKFVDKGSPIEDVLSEAEKKHNFNVVPQNDIRLQIDRVLRSRSLAGQFAQDNGIDRVIREVPDINAFDQYLIAKQAIDVSEQGFKTGRDLTKDRALVRQLESVYEPFAKQIYSYSHKLLDYSVESGLISKELAISLKKKYPNYVPIQRIFSELEKGNTVIGGRRGTASLSKQGIVIKLKGSEREIASPTESLLVKTNDMFNQGERNKAAQMLASYRKLPGFEGLIRPLKEGEKAPHTFSFVKDGKTYRFETTPEIEAAAKNLTVEDFGLIAKIFSVPTRILQMGATALNLPFTVTNLLKDQVTSFINSNKAAKTSLLNPLNFGRALFEAVGHGDLYKESVRNAGMGTSFDIARETPKLTINKIRSGKNVGTKIAYTVTHPEELLRAVENIVGRTEELTRIQQYGGMKNALINEGRTAIDAQLLASKAARENTANFARSGSWGRVLNKVIPFLNAGIQGARQLDRSFQNNPKGTVAKLTIGLFLPTAAVTAWNLSDERRKTVYEDIDKFEKENNLILIPDNPTKDEQGRWNVIKIPIPPGLANLSSLIRRPMEAANGLDPVRFKEIASNLITAGTSFDLSSGSKVASTFTPQAIKPFIETTTNKNLFTGKDIVPSQMRNLPPEEQVYNYTSQAARDLGARLNMSPLKVENFIKTSMGGVGSQLINAYDIALGKGDKAGGESILNQLNRRFSKASGGKILDDVKKESAKGSTAKETLSYDYLKYGKSYDENGLPAQSGDLRDSITNASVRLANPQVLAREAAEARARNKVDGSPINPLYELPWDKQKIVLTITSLPPKDKDKSTLTKANLDWLEPYWEQREDYFDQLKASGKYTEPKGVEGELKRPIASDRAQQLMDQKMWNDPEVSAYLNAYTLWANQEREKLGLPPVEGFTQWPKKPKKVSFKSPTIKLAKLPEFKGAKGLSKGYKIISKPNLKFSPKKIAIQVPKSKSNTIKISRIPTMKVAKGGFLG